MVREADGTWWSVADFFNRHGFDDGDDRVAQRHARTRRDVVVRAVNEVLAERGIPCTASAEDLPTVHNEVRIVLYEATGVEAAVAAFADGTLENAGAAPEVFARVREVWTEILERADRAATRRT
jgi:hypothetical protein